MQNAAFFARNIKSIGANIKKPKKFFDFRGFLKIAAGIKKDCQSRLKKIYIWYF